MPGMIFQETRAWPWDCRRLPLTNTLPKSWLLHAFNPVHQTCHLAKMKQEYYKSNKVKYNIKGKCETRLRFYNQQILKFVYHGKRSRRVYLRVNKVRSMILLKLKRHCKEQIMKVSSRANQTAWLEQKQTQMHLLRGLRQWNKSWNKAASWK